MFKSTKEICAALVPKKQDFFINFKKDTLLRCDKGTLIYIPDNIFELPKYIEGDTNIKIAVQEYYDRSEFVSKNLSTRNNDKHLETGGMFDIKATLDGKKLDLKYEESYVIFVPKKNGLDSMATFYGEFNKENQNNWFSQNELNEINFSKNDSISDSLKFYRCYVEIPESPKGLDNLGRSWRFSEGGEFLWEYFEEKFNADSVNLNPRLNYCEAAYESFYRILLSDDGFFHDLVIEETNDDALDKEIIQFLNDMPSLISNKRIEDIEIFYAINFGSNMKFSKAIYMAHLEEVYSKHVDEGMEKIINFEEDYFALPTMQMGWTNCDRNTLVQTGYIDFYLSDKEYEDVKVFLVIEGGNEFYNAIPVNGDEYLFSNMAQGTNVKAVALAFKDGEAQMQVLESEINDERLVLNDFGEFSIDKFKRELNKEF